MLFIPLEILEKQEKLDAQDIAIIRKHPLKSFRLAKDSGCVSDFILDGIIQHHEQIDGNGYPRKLPGEKICDYAKIISIADNFEAQLTPKKYRDPFAAYIAVKSILSSAETKYDSDILKNFISLISIYPAGTKVLLSNGENGVVSGINKGSPLRPKIKLSDNSIIDLKTASDIYINKVI